MSSRPFTIPPEPTTCPEVTLDGTLEPITADDLLALATSNIVPHYPRVLRRAAREIELLRLDRWRAQRALAISEAARAVEADGHAANDSGDDPAKTVPPPAFPRIPCFQDLIACIPPGGRLQIDFERQHKRMPNCSPFPNCTISS